MAREFATGLLPLANAFDPYALFVISEAAIPSLLTMSSPVPVQVEEAPLEEIGDLVDRAEVLEAFVTTRDLITPVRRQPTPMAGWPQLQSLQPVAAQRTAALPRPVPQVMVHPIRIGNILIQSILSSVSITAILTIALHFSHGG